MTGWPYPSTRLGPSQRQVEMEQHLARLHGTLEVTGKLCYLVLELAAAVDNAAEDIGGSRPQLTILREAVEIATALKGKR